jgi:hypothetical protein
METSMQIPFRALAPALALAAGAAFAGSAQAQSTTYYYDEYDPPTLTYRYDTAPRVYYSDPVVVAPAPRTYYYTAPTVTYRTRTTYYYAPSNHDHYSLSAPGYVTRPAPYGYVTTPAPYGYVPPGLSVTVPTGTYAPLYGGWNAYSNENVGGYDGYRTTADH